MLLKIDISNDFHKLPVVPMKHREIDTHLFQFSKRKFVVYSKLAFSFAIFINKSKEVSSNVHDMFVSNIFQLTSIAQIEIVS